MTSTTSTASPTISKQFSPLFVDAATNNSNSLLNGAVGGVAENVTVTHFSEQRGAMEKISIPSVNIFNAEIKSPKLDNTQRAANITKTTADSNNDNKNSKNPFLNMSPLQSPIPQITSTNPFMKSPSISPNVSTINDTINFANVGAAATTNATASAINGKPLISPKSPFLPKSNPFRDVSTTYSSQPLNQKLDNNKHNLDETDRSDDTAPAAAAASIENHIEIVEKKVNTLFQIIATI